MFSRHWGPNIFRQHKFAHILLSVKSVDLLWKMETVILKQSRFLPSPIFSTSLHNLHTHKKFQSGLCWVPCFFNDSVDLRDHENFFFYVFQCLALHPMALISEEGMCGANKLGLVPKGPTVESWPCSNSMVASKSWICWMVKAFQSQWFH